MCKNNHPSSTEWKYTTYINIKYIWETGRPKHLQRWHMLNTYVMSLRPLFIG